MYWKIWAYGSARSISNSSLWLRSAQIISNFKAQLGSSKERFGSARPKIVRSTIPAPNYIFLCDLKHHEKLYQLILRKKIFGDREWERNKNITKSGNLVYRKTHLKFCLNLKKTKPETNLFVFEILNHIWFGFKKQKINLFGFGLVSIYKKSTP